MGRKYHENLEGTNNVNWSNLEGKTGSKDYASEVNVYSTKAQDISKSGTVKVYDAKFVAKNWNDSETRKMAWSYIQKATYNQIKEHLRELQSTVKGRVARLKASGIPSPALDVWEKNTRGMGWSNAAEWRNRIRQPYSLDGLSDQMGNFPSALLRQSCHMDTGCRCTGDLLPV